jgi:hypothetical protein
MKKMEVFEKTKSDELAELRIIFSKEGLFGKFGELFQIDLILDANVVLADIRWLACKAINRTARTSLIEAIDAKTVVAHAPTFLHIEIEKNIPIIAKEENVDEALLQSAWNNYKKKINFIECGGPVEGEIDPKDFPYVKAHVQTGFPVLSQDDHIKRMGAKAIRITISTFARNYSRDAVVEYKIKAGVLGIFVVSDPMIKAASKFIRSLGTHLKRVPAWVWLLVISGFAFALSFEAVRALLFEKLKEYSAKTLELGEKLFEVIRPVALEHKHRQERANLAKEEILIETKNA